MLPTEGRRFARACRRLATCFIGVALVGLVSASPSLADNVTVTPTSVGVANTNASVPLTGTTISGFSNPAEPLLVSVSTTVGSLSMSGTSGLTLTYGYGSFSGSNFSFSGDQAAVQNGLATLSLSGGGALATADVTVTVTGDQTGIEYLPATGHYYEFVPNTTDTWTEAETAATGYSFDGQQGYLASIPSATVNTFIQNHLNGAQNVWAGGMSVDYPNYDYPLDPNAGRVWSWQQGPLAGTVFTMCDDAFDTCEHVDDSGDYYDWNSGEPNNDGYDGSDDGSGEHYLEINYLGTGKWNDIPNSTTIAGFVVEFGTNAAGGGFSGVYSGSADVTLEGAPSAPSGVSANGASSAGGQATVSWTAPANNGSAITGYTVTASPGGQTCAWSSGPLQCTVTGLTNGTSYTFSVVAANGIGTSTAGTTSAGVSGAPGAPTSASATASAGQAMVSWTAPSPNGLAITAYTVTASPGGRTCSWTSGPLQCTVTGLTNGTGYTFTVTATNGNGAGNASNVTSSVTPLAVPGSPTAVSANGGSVPGSQATISWTAPASNGGTTITGYTVTASPGGRTCAWSSGPLQCTVTGLSNGTSYTFTAQATNSVGNSTASTASSSTVVSGVPGTPSNVTAVASAGQASVSWTAPPANGSAITDYTVVSSPDGQTCSWSSGPAQCTVTGLTNGTSYTFTVVASNANGNGNQSAASSAVTPLDVPGAPTGVTASAGSIPGGQATVSWTAPADDGGTTVTGYTVTASPGGETCVWSTGPLQCTVTGLSNGSSYTFTVQATNSVGNSTPSGATGGTLVVEFPHAPVVAAPADQTDTNNATPAFSGTSDPSDTITVMLGSTTLGTTQADGSGYWTFTPSSPIADGTYTVTATATDAYSNVSPSSAGSSLTIDTTAPVAPVIGAPADGAVSNNVSPTVTLTGEPGTSATVEVDGVDYGPVTLDGSGNAHVSIPGPLSPGAHTVRARLTDAAGNTGAWSPVSSWTVKLATDVQLSGPTDGPTNAVTPSVTVTGEPGDQYVITVDGQTVLTGVVPASGTGAVTLPTALADGAHTIAVVATDAAGNQASDSIVVTIDTVAPDPVQVGQAPASITDSTSATFSFSESKPGVQYQCALDGGAWAPCPDPVTFTGLGDGPHTLLVRALDPAGNVSVSTQYAWTVMTTPPPPPVVLGGPSSLATPTGTVMYSTPAGTTFEFSPVPDTTLECSLDGGAYVPCGAQYQTGKLALGAHTLAVRQVDEAGNTSAPKVIDWRVLPRTGTAGLPTASELLVATDATAAGERSLLVGCNLNAGSVRSCEVSIDHDGRLIGHGTVELSRRGESRSVVTVSLNEAGRHLLALAVGGLPVTLHGTVDPFGFHALTARSHTVLYAPLRYAVRDVQFTPGGSSLTRSGHAVLAWIARQLTGASTVVCEGNTDNVGSYAYNYALGLDRARSVCRTLRRLGVHARVSAVSYAYDRPVASNQTAAGRAENRRVVIQVSYHDLPLDGRAR